MIEPGFLELRSAFVFTGAGVALAAIGAVLSRLVFNAASQHRLGDRLPDAEAVVADWPEGARSGRVFVDGEMWRAVSPQPLAPGSRVRIRAVDGLTLHVGAAARRR